MSELNDQNYKEVLKQDKYMLIDFFATWCMPCKMLSPIVEEVAEERKEIEVFKVDVDENEELAAAFGIASIPTLAIVKSGTLLGRSVGFISKDQLNRFIDESLNK